MKGKIAFVVGAAVGYVFGTRAGRRRYEQIKRGAKTVWETDAVQRCVESTRGVAQGKLDELFVVASRAGKEAFVAFTRTASSQQPPAAPESPADPAAENASDPRA